MADRLLDLRLQLREQLGLCGRRECRSVREEYACDTSVSKQFADLQLDLQLYQGALGASAVFSVHRRAHQRKDRNIAGSKHQGWGSLGDLQFQARIFAGSSA